MIRENTIHPTQLWFCTRLLITLLLRLQWTPHLHLSMSTSRLRQVCTQHQFQCLSTLRLRLQWTPHLHLSVSTFVSGEYAAPAPDDYIAPAPTVLHEIRWGAMPWGDLRSYAMWYVWVESAFGDASGTAAHLLQAGHGERFRHDCVMSRGSTRWSGRALIVACLRMKMTSWYAARGRTAACVRLITIYLACSTDVARLPWATRRVHGGRIVRGAHQ